MKCPNESLIMEILNCEITTNFPSHHLPLLYKLSFNDSSTLDIKHKLETRNRNERIRLNEPGVIEVTLGLNVSSFLIEYSFLIEVENKQGK